ncbi:diguanylate cyclase (GGDEF)-like protein [Desulfohalotomaculum tongense]|uniref:GGDEF domain-containing protein n=1 Tax=Desulforadius tongensis TaxID=1216062 RepID=UPI00195DF427|nr:GGDEF domain-containing protein [Desulforadius tongensis]MBM7854945.1 diguanylate cyclase (GGDEF)-like protein [Desulforadius tongensis]
MKRIKFFWETISPYQIFGLNNLRDLRIVWPECKQENLDFLTGLPNRQVYEATLSYAVQEADRQNAAFGILVLDLDKFKSINDTYGHPVGDEVLKIFAVRAKNATKPDDYLARYGGEEFVLITPCYRKVFDIGERVRTLVSSQPFKIQEMEIPVTLSFGCAVYPIDGAAVQEVFKKADDALYEAKESGRNRGKQYNPG